MGALLMTSCLTSDDDSGIIYNNDTAITAFSLTTVNRYIHTTSKSGKDSVYKRVITNPATFNIDQYEKRIFNTDSIYADCDLKHVLVTITTKNSGVVAIKDIASDTLRTYNSTDSIDRALTTRQTLSTSRRPGSFASMPRTAASIVPIRSPSTSTSRSPTRSFGKRCLLTVIPSTPRRLSGNRS